MAGHVRIVMNPISGRGLGAKVLPEIEAGLRELDYEISVLRTQKAGDGRRVLEGQDLPPEYVLAMGGDGTVNEVINGLAGTDVALAIFPMGTSNVFCKEIGLRPKVKTVLDLFKDGHIRQVDLGEVDGRRFLSVAGCGPDAYAVEVLTAIRRGTIWMCSYAWPLYRTLTSYGFPALRVEVDGELMSDDACAVVIGNTAAHGGPLVFTPDARVDDGVFDVVTFRRHTRWHMIKYLLGGLLRIHMSFRDTTHRRGRVVAVTTESATQVPAQVDGDTAGHLPKTFRLLPGAIRVLAPRQ